MFLKFQQLSCFAPKVIQHSLHTAIIHNVNVDSGSSFQSVNPATGRSVGIVSDCTKNETLSAIESAHDCYPHSELSCSSIGEILSPKTGKQLQS